MVHFRKQKLLQLLRYVARGGIYSSLPKQVAGVERFAFQFIFLVGRHVSLARSMRTMVSLPLSNAQDGSTFHNA